MNIGYVLVTKNIVSSTSAYYIMRSGAYNNNYNITSEDETTALPRVYSWFAKWVCAISFVRTENNGENRVIWNEKKKKNQKQTGCAKRVRSRATNRESTV